jgi:hypothetical protein
MRMIHRAIALGIEAHSAIKDTEPLSLQSYYRHVFAQSIVEQLVQDSMSQRRKTKSRTGSKRDNNRYPDIPPLPRASYDPTDDATGVASRLG